MPSPDELREMEDHEIARQVALTEAAAIATLGLFALQHRGQESAGVAVSDGEQVMLYKDLGMISTVLDERRAIDRP